MYNTQLERTHLETVFEESDEYEANINKRGEENTQIALFWTMYLFWKMREGYMFNKLFYFAYYILQLLRVIYS